MVGIIAGGLGWLGGRALPLAVLIGGAAFGGTLALALDMINLRHR
jgi:hypothetical protein